MSFESIVKIEISDIMYADDIFLYVDILKMFKDYPPMIIGGQNNKIEYEMIERLNSYKNLV